jgi:hypothetical protein
MVFLDRKARESQIAGQHHVLRRRPRSASRHGPRRSTRRLLGGKDAAEEESDRGLPPQGRSRAAHDEGQERSSSSSAATTSSTATITFSQVHSEVAGHSPDPVSWDHENRDHRRERVHRRRLCDVARERGLGVITVGRTSGERRWGSDGRSCAARGGRRRRPSRRRSRRVGAMDEVQDGADSREPRDRHAEPGRGSPVGEAAGARLRFRDRILRGPRRRRAHRRFIPGRRFSRRGLPRMGGGGRESRGSGPSRFASESCSVPTAAH